MWPAARFGLVVGYLIERADGRTSTAAVLYRVDRYYQGELISRYV